SNGFRPRRFFGSGAMLELKVPRSRSGTFYPMLLSCQIYGMIFKNLFYNKLLLVFRSYLC
ncbi:MAG: hypothetical protein EAZ27_13750, partial [Cytophagales bacterium]